MAQLRKARRIFSDRLRYPANFAFKLADRELLIAGDEAECKLNGFAVLFFWVWLVHDSQL
jgi:hypothetical protein